MPTPESPESEEVVPSAAAQDAPDAAPDLVDTVPDESAVSTTTAPARIPKTRVFTDLGHPFRWGFFAAAGALVAIGAAMGIAGLSGIFVSIGVALFIALALDPLVRWFQARGLGRGVSIVVVFVGFAALIALLLALVLPVAFTQIAQLAASVPGYIVSVEQSGWFKRIVEMTGQSGDVYQTMLGQLGSWLGDPQNLLALGGGALAVGSGAINAFSGTLIVLVLTLYFLATLTSMKKALYSLAPAYSRPRLADLTDKITAAVGDYVAGMVILAFCNAVFAFLLLTIFGVPFAPLLALLALGITMIPMVGPAIFWVIASSIALFNLGWAGLFVAVLYFAYMEVEAYLLTPKVMNRAVSVPGSLVLIGAMVGATLLGLLGALVAVPVTASVLLIIREVFIPQQDARVTRDE